MFSTTSLSVPAAALSMVALMQPATAAEPANAERGMTGWAAPAGDPAPLSRTALVQASTPGTGCSFPEWIPTKPYAPLSIVTYESRPYFAKYVNPGYNPVISSYFWGPYACPVSTRPGCAYADWMRDWPYAAGSIVRYEGALYVAKFDNPGYVPTVSTYYWAPHECPAATTASAP